MDGQIGRLAPGYKADVVFLDLGNVNFVPLNDIAGLDPFSWTPDPLGGRGERSPRCRRPEHRGVTLSHGVVVVALSSLMAYPSFVEIGDSIIARIRRPHLIT